MPDTDFLLASLFWGTVGVAFFVYGKKQGLAAPMIGGGLLVGASYLIHSALILSLVGIGLIAGTVWGIKQGY